MMDEIYKQLDSTLEYTEDNINEYVNPILGRDLDSYEKFIILGKMHHSKEEVINNIEVKHGVEDVESKYIIGIDPYESEETSN